MWLQVAAILVKQHKPAQAQTAVVMVLKIDAIDKTTAVLKICCGTALSCHEQNNSLVCVAAKL
jgi:hypothetical protein